ncbi:hypothetical protein HDU96_000082 [Phlyctochytrium bullatum]|nr:hypothetical protein HDU96_000082 [Phlyctochytrium bullatum]
MQLFKLSTLVAAVASLAATANAYGSFGHTTVGEMAQKLLTTQGTKLVVDLLNSDSLGGSSANWADQIKGSEPTTGPWHYIDVTFDPPAQCGFKAADCGGRDCIVAAITDQTNVLLSNKCAVSSATTRALLFLSHFIGDITQPMHNVNRGRGGNDNTLKFDGSSSNFHASESTVPSLHTFLSPIAMIDHVSKTVHDTAIPVKRAKEVGYTNAAAYATYLINQYTSQKGTFASSSFVAINGTDSNNLLNSAISIRTQNMSKDGNALNCKVSGFWTLYDRNPSQDFGSAYYTAVKVDMEIQLAKAGFRLASWVNNIAAACYGGSSTNPTPTPTPTPTPGSTCSHSVCTTGVALKYGCSACANKVITYDSYCGDTEWDSYCVGYVPSQCGITC